MEKSEQISRIKEANVILPTGEECCREGPGAPGAQQVDHKPAACPCGQERQLKRVWPTG